VANKAGGADEEFADYHA
jgi:integrase